MINVDLVHLGYYAFRLAPLIIVCSFLLQSILNTDAKGFVFLLGLVLTIGICGIIPILRTEVQPSEAKCKITDLSFISYGSGIPVNFIIYGFVFSFLTTIILKYKLQSLNWPTFIFFPVMMILDAWWALKQSCAYPIHVIVGYAVSIVAGASYAGVLIGGNLQDLQIWNGVSSNETCKRPSRAYYKCTSLRDKTKPISVKKTTSL